MFDFSTPFSYAEVFITMGVVLGISTIFFLFIYIKARKK